MRYGDLGATARGGGLEMQVLYIVLETYCLSKDEPHWKNRSLQNINNAIRNEGNGKYCAPIGRNVNSFNKIKTLTNHLRSSFIMYLFQ